MSLLIALFACTSLLLIVLAIPMIRERVKPNGWYGFRIPLTMNDPEIWYPVNKLAGKWLLGYAILLLLVSLGLPVLLAALGYPLDSDRAVTVYSLVVAGYAIGGILVVFLVGWIYARRLADW
jgi:hypothetical protein